MSNIAIICLSIACAVLSIVTLAGSLVVPLLIWKCFRLESRVEILDEVLDGLCQAVSVGKPPDKRQP